MLNWKIVAGAMGLGCGLALWGQPFPSGDPVAVPSQPTLETKAPAYGRVHILAGVGAPDGDAGQPVVDVDLDEVPGYLLVAAVQDHALLACATVPRSHAPRMGRLDLATQHLSPLHTFEGLLEPDQDGSLAQDRTSNGISRSPFHYTGLWVLEDGSVLASDLRKNRVVRAFPETGRVEVFAGTGSPGALLDPSPLATQLDHPCGLAQMPDGSVLILDHNNHRILRVGTDRRLSLFAGTGEPGDTLGGSALETRLKYPSALAVGPEGRVWVADGNGRVLRIDPDRSVRRVAGTGSQEDTFDPTDATRTRLCGVVGLACLKDGSILVADCSQHGVLQVGTDRSVRVLAGWHRALRTRSLTGLNNPQSLAVLPDGTVVIADYGNRRILSISPQDDLQARLGDLVARGAAALKAGDGHAAGAFAELDKMSSPPADHLCDLMDALPSTLARVVVGYLEPTPWERTRIRQARAALSRLAPPRTATETKADSRFPAGPATGR